PKEEEFKEEEEDPQEDEDDMEIDIKEDENEPKLACPYEETDSLNPPPPASESELDNEIEVENLIKHEDETVPVSVYETTVCVDQGTAAMERLVEKLGNVKEKAECKKLKKELKEAKIMPPKSTPMTQAAMQRMIKESVDAAIAVERERKAKVRNDASEFGLVRGQSTIPVVHECTFAGFMNECVEGKKVRFAGATLGLKNGEVTSSNPVNLNKAVRMAHKLMKQKSQARNERILEGKKRKRENHQGGNSSGKGNQKDNPHQTSQNYQKQGNAQAMVTAPTEGKLSLCERCFTHHVGPCTIKCHKCGNVRHKLRYYKEKNVATGANAQPILTCYDCGEHGHTMNRCPKKVKQEEVGEVRARAYAIKDAESKGPNMVTGTFLLNNRYASILFDSGSDRSFVNTRFSLLLDIKPIKIKDSYEVELADGRIVSTNTILKGYTLSLVNHIFEIDLMSIELGTFDIIICMDWLVKHDAVIVCGEKLVRIPYENKMLIVEGDKGESQLKVISCIKARKYIEQGCHLFLAHVMKKKSKEKRLEDVPVIHDFPEELPGLSPLRQVKF
ncbi:putative reverse transcriptase domain-containing protein, partial [Tanacetum coccineum]